MSGDARSFGIWLGRRFEELKHKEAGIYNYDYMDYKNQRLRYRLICDMEFKKFISEILAEISHKGWHVTSAEKLRRNRYQFSFEPTLAPRVPRTNVFWHLTEAKNVLSILENGLIPQNSRYTGITYPQKRTYLLKNKSDISNMAFAFSNRDKNPKKYVVLKIDLRNAKNIKVHIDPELSRFAVYTTDSIPREYISPPTIDSQLTYSSRLLLEEIEKNINDYARRLRLHIECRQYFHRNTLEIIHETALPQKFLDYISKIETLVKIRIKI